MEAVAKLKNCPYPARKMRLLADLVRGKKVEEALNILKFHPKKAYSKKLEKLVLSAIANWQVKNEDLGSDDNDLFVKLIFVDNARQLKRIKPAPQGRAHRIRKRSNHITVVVDVEVQSILKENTIQE
ncbi:MAG: 50S ribosomal protein L22 [Bacteroidota bacterium]|nr:50S ribosomal protein L22 [Bacteroidota bacterium]